MIHLFEVVRRPAWYNLEVMNALAWCKPTPLTHITPTMVSRINACPFQVACDRYWAI